MKCFFKWVLSIFSFTGKPLQLRDLPLLLAKVLVWGILTGPIFAFVFVLAEDPRHVLNFLSSPRELATTGVVGAVWALSFYIFLGFGNAYLKRWIDGYPRAISFTISLAFNVVGASMAVLVAGTVSAVVTTQTFNIPSEYYWRLAVINAALAVLLAVIIKAFIALRIQVERTQTELRKQELATARAQSLALQAQINPHFFFNTLNTISALIDDDPAAARRNIGRLADLFRYTLGCTMGTSDAASTAVDLDQELDFVRDYLAIEQERFRRRLHLEFPEQSNPGVKVPGLILQPLVENAIKHGIAPRIDGGTVSIRVEPAGPNVRVTVRNTSDGDPLPADPALFRPGHALDNVRARLRMFTGRPDPLTATTGTGYTEFGFEISSGARATGGAIG